MIVLVGATKGGVGKTTIVTNLAAIDVGKGSDSILVDSDRQGSAASWSEAREQSETGLKRIPTVQKYGNRGLINELKELDQKYDNVWVDSGGHDSEEMRSAMLAADLLLIPVRPSQLDVWILPRLLDLIAQAQAFNDKLKYSFVINGAHTNPNVKDAEELEELLEGQPVCKTVIRHRRAYAKAPIAGVSVTELQGKDFDQKASDEVIALYKEITNG